MSQLMHDFWVDEVRELQLKREKSKAWDIRIWDFRNADS